MLWVIGAGLSIAAVAAQPVRSPHTERLLIIYHLAIANCVKPEDHWCRKAIQKRGELLALGWKFK
jgi:hypothetical protein